MADRLHELIIIGGGPAGLAAGIYAARDGLDCLLFEKGSPGGQIVSSSQVENYPGFPHPISGLELAEKMKEQALRFGLAIAEREVTSLAGGEGTLRVAAGGETYRSRAVIVATGATYRSLGVPGEERLRGRGVSYCGSCDGPLFRGRRVSVVGGGDTAIEEALFLSRFASTTTVIHRRDRLRASPHFRKRALSEKRIGFIWHSVVREILGDEAVRAVIVEDVRDGARSEVPCEGVFIFIGSVPNSGFLKGFLDLDEGGYIVTDIAMRASIPGVFAAGDVRSHSARQVASSVGDGVTALREAECYLAAL